WTSPQSTFATPAKQVSARSQDSSVALQRQRKELAAAGTALVLIMLVATVLIILATSAAQRPSRPPRQSVIAPSTSPRPSNALPEPVHSGAGEPPTQESQEHPSASAFLEEAKEAI